MTSVLIIDDEDNLRKLMVRILQLEGYMIFEAPTAKTGLKILEREVIHTVVSDVKLPDINGIVLTSQIKELYPALEIIVLTAYGTIEDGVQSIKNGAFDYLIKGDDNNKLVPLVAKATEKARLQFKVRELEDKIYSKSNFNAIIGKSEALATVILQAKKVAKTDTNVLLTGETGTGKEVFAQAIHTESLRNGKSFVALNCSAFSKEVIESELFGYKAGAFTVANKDKKGLFEEAHDGTIFLDEIGEMSLELQAKLLRVLESQEFIKVGDTKPTKVNVRIISATNKDLQRESETHNFRLDLFYRLSVFQIMLPSLSERIEDIPQLIENFVLYFANKTNKKAPSVSTDFVKALQTHQWKGNIRELKNVIERAIILCDDGVLTPTYLPFDFNISRTQSEGASDLASIEKAHIQKIMLYANGNKAKAAEILGIGLTTLYRKVEEYRL